MAAGVSLVEPILSGRYMMLSVPGLALYGALGLVDLWSSYRASRTPPGAPWRVVATAVVGPRRAHRGGRLAAGPRGRELARRGELRLRRGAARATRCCSPTTRCGSSSSTTARRVWPTRRRCRRPPTRPSRGASYQTGDHKYVSFTDAAAPARPRRRADRLWIVVGRDHVNTGHVDEMLKLLPAASGWPSRAASTAGSTCCCSSGRSREPRRPVAPERPVSPPGCGPARRDGAPWLVATRASSAGREPGHHHDGDGSHEGQAGQPHEVGGLRHVVGRPERRRRPARPGPPAPRRSPPAPRSSAGPASRHAGAPRPATSNTSAAQAPTTRNAAATSLGRCAAAAAGTATPTTASDQCRRQREPLLGRPGQQQEHEGDRGGDRRRGRSGSVFECGNVRPPSIGRSRPALGQPHDGRPAEEEGTGGRRRARGPGERGTWPAPARRRRPAAASRAA